MAYGQPKVINDIEGEGVEPGAPAPNFYTGPLNEGLVYPSKKGAPGMGAGIGGGLAGIMAMLGGKPTERLHSPAMGAPLSAPSGTGTFAPAPMPGAAVPRQPMGESAGGVSPALMGLLTGGGQGGQPNVIQALMAQQLKRRQPVTV